MIIDFLSAPPTLNYFQHLLRGGTFKIFTPNVFPSYGNNLNSLSHSLSFALIAPLLILLVERADKQIQNN